MKKVLWISRHALNNEQIDDLKRIYNDEIEIITVDKTIEHIKSLKKDIEKCDIIAAVLPLDKLAELCEISGEKPVIRSSSKRIPTNKTIINENGSKERIYLFKHQYWEEIYSVNIESARLS